VSFKKKNYSAFEVSMLVPLLVIVLVYFKERNKNKEKRKNKIYNP
jgi:uncharacterized membrane protein YadS